MPCYSFKILPGNEVLKFKKNSVTFMNENY